MEQQDIKRQQRIFPFHEVKSNTLVSTVYQINSVFNIGHFYSN